MAQFEPISLILAGGDGDNGRGLKDRRKFNHKPIMLSQNKRKRRNYIPVMLFDGTINKINKIIYNV